MNITELTKQERPLWDAYVQQHPHGLPQQLAGWRDVLAQTYGYETCYLMAVGSAGNGERQICGILPLFFVKSLLVGRTATTMPGGLCADNEAVAAALTEQGMALAQKAQFRRFLLQDTRQVWPGPLTATTQHVSWQTDLEIDADAYWQSLHRNIRRQVRMAERNELVAQVDRVGNTADAFYNVLSHFTHQAGTPVFGRNFIQNVIQSFPGQFNIVTIWLDQQPIGAYFQLEMNKTVYGLWGATLHDYLKLRPVYLAYWTILQDAMTQGFAHLDMGRSPAESNASQFKAQWGGYSAPVYQQSVNLQDKQQTAMSVTTQTQTSGKMRSFMQLWPKLPFPVTLFLGPKLRRHVPFA